MKRQAALRYLHMGCGEGLVARLSLTTTRAAQPATAPRTRAAKPKKGGDRR